MERVFYSSKENVLFWIVKIEQQNLAEEPLIQAYVKKFVAICPQLMIVPKEVNIKIIRRSRRYKNMHVFYAKTNESDPQNIVCIEKTMDAWIENEN